MKGQTLLVGCFVVVMCIIASCSMERRNAESDYERRHYIVQLGQDGTTYGTLLSTPEDTALCVVTDGGDTLYLELVGDEVLKGDIIPGQRVALELDGKNKDYVRQMLNLSMLMGEWVQPSPLAEGTFTGVELTEGGTATSINSQTTNYEGWMLYDGRLLLLSTALGLEGTEQMVDTFEVVRLTRDSLYLSGTESRYYFCRQEALKVEEGIQPYRDDADHASDYDLFNPESGVHDVSNEVEDDLLY